MQNQQLAEIQPRYQAMDWLRVIAAAGVVLLHATTPYLVHPMPGLVWPVTDQSSHFADGIGWGIEIVIMPLFLLMAGFFAYPSFRRLGGHQFLRNRFHRLIVPLLVFAPWILTADCYVWLTGYLVEGYIEPRKLRSLKLDQGLGEGFWGLSHLWFLPYLFLYCVVWVFAQSERLEHVRRTLIRPLWGYLRHGSAGGLVACTLASTCTLMLWPQIVFGFQHAFLPVPSKWLYSGTYFAGGVLLASQPSLLAGCAALRRRLLVIGGGALCAAVLFGWQWLEQVVLRDVPGRTLQAIPAAAIPWQIAAALSTVTAAWSLSLGLIGWGVSSTIACGPVLRYFAAASFWVYVFHHPIVGLAHIQLKVLFPNVLPEAKVFLSMLIAIAFSLLTFELLGRRDPCARLLGLPADLCKRG